MLINCSEKIVIFIQRSFKAHLNSLNISFPASFIKWHHKHLPNLSGTRLCHSGHGASQQGDWYAEEAVWGHLPRAKGRPARGRGGQVSAWLGLPGEGQDSGREGEHTVKSRSNCICCQNTTKCGSFSVWDDRKNSSVWDFFPPIRTLCDNLRRERDRAVSDLADALRNLDDMRKQKNDTARELKELRQALPLQIWIYFYSISGSNMDAINKISTYFIPDWLLIIYLSFCAPCWRNDFIDWLEFSSTYFMFIIFAEKRWMTS